MNRIELSCPSCQFRQLVPAEKIPPGATTATCPQCRNRFALTRQGASRPQPDGTPRVHTLGQLFDSAWGQFCRRWKTLIALHLLTYSLLFLPMGLGFAAGLLVSSYYPETEKQLIILGTLCGLAIGVLLMFWGYASFMAAIADAQLGVRAALRRGRTLLSPYLWALSLSGLLILGGGLFFLIPGMMMTVWFLFIPFILLESPERGMRALRLSRHYVRGYWWEVFGKFFLVSLVPSALSAIPFVGPIVGMLSVPYVTLMLYQIYRDQKLRRPAETLAANDNNALGWWAMALAGYALLLIPLLYFFSQKLGNSVQQIAL